MSIGSVLKRLQETARMLVILLRGIREYGQDCLRFIRHSGISRKPQQESLASLIFAQAHAIEKGLSFNTPRPGFGKAKIASLLTSLRTFRDAGYDTTCAQYQSAVLALRHYRTSCGVKGSPLPCEAEEFLALAIESVSFRGGADLWQRELLLRNWTADFYHLARNRHSIRDFAKTPVDLNAILKAVDLARSAPSSCNRQQVRVHVLRNRGDIEAVLREQGGAVGFYESIDTLLMVVVDSRGYCSLSERSLGFVDGGLFAMTLIYAICYEGLGCCPLHLALSARQQSRIRKMLSLQASEMLVLMIGVGALPDNVKVTCSQRKSLEEYVCVH